jgi:hypothetical protein
VHDRAIAEGCARWFKAYKIRNSSTPLDVRVDALEQTVAELVKVNNTLVSIIDEMRMVTA